MVLVRKRLVQVMRVTDAVHPCMDTAAVALDRKDMDNTADVRAVIDKRQWMASAVCHNGRGALGGVWHTMGRGGGGEGDGGGNVGLLEGSRGRERF